MNHTLTDHTSFLNYLCRLCGGKVLTLTEKKKYKLTNLQCTNFARDILFVYEHNIETDNELIHSKYACPKCISRICNIKKRCSAISLQTAKKLFLNSKDIWCYYDQNKTIEQCNLCSHCHLLRLGHPFAKNVSQRLTSVDDSIIVTGPNITTQADTNSATDNSHLYFDSTIRTASPSDEITSADTVSIDNASLPSTPSHTFSASDTFIDNSSPILSSTPSCEVSSPTLIDSILQTPTTLIKTVYWTQS